MTFVSRDTLQAGLVAVLLAYLGGYIGDAIPEVAQGLLSQSATGAALLVERGYLPKDGTVRPMQEVWPRTILLMIHVFALFVVIGRVREVGRRLFLPISRTAHTRPPKRSRALILFLSSNTLKIPRHLEHGCGEDAKLVQGQGQAEDDSLATPIAGLADIPTALSNLALGKCIMAKTAFKEADREALPAIRYRSEKTYSWWTGEQPLRGIWHHLKPSNTPYALEKVILCGSTTTLRDSHAFAALLKRHFAELRHVSFHALSLLPGSEARLLDLQLPREALPSDDELNRQGLDFEDQPQMLHALNQVLEQLDAEGIPAEHITIDCTGGHKPTSIAAASVSFNRDTRVQYVPTNPDGGPETDWPWTYTVRSYDFHFIQQDPREGT